MKNIIPAIISFQNCQLSNQCYPNSIWLCKWKKLAEKIAQRKEIGVSGWNFFRTERIIGMTRALLRDI